MNTAKNHNFLILQRISNHAHARVAHVIQPVGVVAVFDSEPALLIQQKQVDIVEKGSAHLLTEFVVATTGHHDSTTNRQMSHHVREPWCGRQACVLDVDELSGGYTAFRELGL